MSTRRDLPLSAADLKRLIWTARLELERARRNRDVHAARRAERRMNAMLDQFAHKKQTTTAR